MTGITDHALHGILVEIDERTRDDAVSAPVESRDGGSDFQVATRGMEFTIGDGAASAPVESGDEGSDFRVITRGMEFTIGDDTAGTGHTG